MLIKKARLKIEASSVIDRDILLRGPSKTAFIKHDISDNIIMSSNVFIDKKTGEKVKITNEDVNFIALDNGVSIKKDIFSTRYEEQVEVDAESFFQKNTSADPLQNIANQLKNVDTSKLNDNTTGTKVKYTPPVVLSDNSGAEIRNKPSVEEEIPMSTEEKKAMLDKWRKEQPGAQIPDVQNKDWEEDNRFLNGDKPIPQPKPPEPKVDPIQMMFKMFKSNYPVKLNVEIEEKIPNPTFIGMVQENVEADAVEYYAKLISDKLLKDPTKLKDEVYKQLKSIIDKNWE